MDDFSYHTVFLVVLQDRLKNTGCLKKQYMINSARLTGERFKAMQNGCFRPLLPLSYVAGKLMLVRAIELGAGILIWWFHLRTR
jgi:O-succinylbenzoic acid--CoA ligase